MSTPMRRIRVGLLCPHRKRPHRRTAEPYDELAPSHRSSLPAAVQAVGYRGRGCMGMSLDLFCSAGGGSWPDSEFCAMALAAPLVIRMQRSYPEKQESCLKTHTDRPPGTAQGACLTLLGEYLARSWEWDRHNCFRRASADMVWRL
jgi:hypothetical protein